MYNATPLSAAAAAMGRLIDQQFAEARKELGDVLAAQLVAETIAEASAERIETGVTRAQQRLMGTFALLASTGLAEAGVSDIAQQHYDTAVSASSLDFSKLQTVIGQISELVDACFAALASSESPLEPREAALILGAQAGEASAQNSALGVGDFDDRIRIWTTAYLGSTALRAAGVVEVAILAFVCAAEDEAERLRANAGAGGHA
jgi:hypothetical protein